MNVGKSLRDHYLRIDARSLGLFRLAFGLVLLSDLVRRFRYLKDFYSNEGVLPNHNHLFNLHDARVAEVPICYTERRLGESKMSKGVIAEALVRPWVLFLRRLVRARRSSRAN